MSMGAPGLAVGGEAVKILASMFGSGNVDQSALVRRQADEELHGQRQEHEALEEERAQHLHEGHPKWERR